MVYIDFSKMRYKWEIMSECNFKSASTSRSLGNRG